MVFLWKYNFRKCSVPTSKAFFSQSSKFSALITSSAVPRISEFLSQSSSLVPQQERLARLNSLRRLSPVVASSQLRKLAGGAFGELGTVRGTNRYLSTIPESNGREPNKQSHTNPETQNCSNTSASSDNKSTTNKEEQNYDRSDNQNDSSNFRNEKIPLSSLVYFIVNVIAASVCLTYALVQAYAYFFSFPDPLEHIWSALKDDPWLEAELGGGPLKLTRQWSGFVNDEDAKLRFEITGANGIRRGWVHADLIRSLDGSLWNVVSIRFGRTDEEAKASGTAVDDGAPEGGMVLFTSKVNPEDKTDKSVKVIPSNWVPLSDDIVAAAMGYSTDTSQSKEQRPVNNEGSGMACPFKARK